MSMFLFLFVLLSVFSSEATAQSQWQPVAAPAPTWGADRDRPAVYRQPSLTSKSTTVIVCPPNYQEPKVRTTHANTVTVGCSNGRTTNYLYSLEFSEMVTVDTGAMVEVRYSDNGWLTAVVYAYKPMGHMMAFPQAFPGQEETLQVLVGAGRVTVGYYDPDSGTVVATQRRVPGTRFFGRFFYSGPVPQ